MKRVVRSIRRAGLQVLLLALFGLLTSLVCIEYNQDYLICNYETPCITMDTVFIYPDPDWNIKDSNGMDQEFIEPGDDDFTEEVPQIESWMLDPEYFSDPVANGP